MMDEIVIFLIIWICMGYVLSAMEYIYYKMVYGKISIMAWIPLFRLYILGKLLLKKPFGFVTFFFFFTLFILIGLSRSESINGVLVDKYYVLPFEARLVVTIIFVVTEIILFIILLVKMNKDKSKYNNNLYNQYYGPIYYKEPEIKVKEEPIEEEIEEKKIELISESKPKKKKNVGIIICICIGIIIVILLLILIILLLKQENKTCNNNSSDIIEKDNAKEEITDNHIKKIRNYVNKNAASVGYEGMNDHRRDDYGNTTVELVFMNVDGTYIGVTDDELKDYVIIEQDYKPETELKYEFVKENGEEIHGLIGWQNIEKIILRVKKVGESNPQFDNKLKKISVPKNKYENYLRNYVGLNLANCASSYGKSLQDKYSFGYVKLKLQTKDGLYVDISDEEGLKNYKVVSQDVAPNTKITFVYAKDSDGKEYYSYIESQSIEQIYLTVEKIK